MMLYPERRFFLASQVTETMVAIQTSPMRDLYVVYAGRSPETGKPVIHAYLNPLVKWIWFGGMVLVLGTILAMLPNRRTALVLRPVDARESAGAKRPLRPRPWARLRDRKVMINACSRSIARQTALALASVRFRCSRVRRDAAARSGCARAGNCHVRRNSARS